MLHHYVSYDITLLHIDLYVQVNGEDVYHHFVTGQNTSTIYCYQVSKKGDSSYDHKVNTGCFWSKWLYNPFTHNLCLEEKFESSDDKSDTKDDRTKNTNIKEVGNDVNGKITSLM